MHIPSHTCPICKKSKGGYTKRKDHSACSKVLQQKFEKLNKVREQRYRTLA